YARRVAADASNFTLQLQTGMLLSQPVQAGSQDWNHAETALKRDVSAARPPRSRLGRSPGTAGGDQGGIGDADTRGSPARPSPGLAAEDADRLGLGPLAPYVDERSPFQPGEPFLGAHRGLQRPDADLPAQAAAVGVGPCVGAGQPEGVGEDR